MVPDAEPRSYYGRPIVKPPVWKARNIAGYFTLGGIAAGSSLLAAGGDLTGRAELRRACRLVSVVALSGSVAALIDDLGRPSRFLNMLRVFRPTSPMSVGSWLLALYGPLAGAAALSEITPACRTPRHGGTGADAIRTAGSVAGVCAALLAPGVATYTAVILADTAVPAWNGSRRELPFVFAGSAASSAGGAAVLLVPPEDAAPARLFAVLGTMVELVAEARMEARLGTTREAVSQGRAGAFVRAGRVLAGAGALCAGAGGRRSRTSAILGGVALVLGSACTRFGIFYAGVASAEDPRFTIATQRGEKS
ncbi:MAG: NrfD/PsrC family molybdoenzyme membrane anchor subunit [Solirubrobacteraceae bacterium]